MSLQNEMFLQCTALKKLILLLVVYFFIKFWGEEIFIPQSPHLSWFHPCNEHEQIAERQTKPMPEF